MTVFVDTSALYAMLNVGDIGHEKAKAGWAQLRHNREELITSNYVLLETVALTGRRMGIEGVRVFQNLMAPILHVHWVDAPLHERAVAAHLTAGVRDLSLVDCVSFELMRRLGIDTAFAFDSHFVNQGFNCIP